MKPTFYINMTSGISGPELELTEEQAKPLIELIEKLDTPWTGSTYQGMPSSDHYTFYWQEGDVYYGVMTQMSGLVWRWSKKDSEWSYLQDTVGLWAALAVYAGPAYQKWIKGMEEEAKLSEGYEPIFNIFKP